jgi:putative membrane protein
MIGQLPVFAFLVFADHVYYPTYQFAPRIIELTAMEDQILGGLVMKASNLLVSLIILGMGFYALTKESENSQ